MTDDYKDIHGFEFKLERIRDKINRDRNILPRNKKYILDFETLMHAKGLKAASIHKDLYSLWFIGRHLKADFKKATRSDIIGLCSIIEKQKWAEKTKRNHTIAIKKMWKYLFNIDQKGVYPEAVSWINTAPRKKREKLPEEILSEDEIKAMLEACSSLRDRAFTSLLFETGARIGEILNLRIKHVVFSDWGGAYVMLNGKTGMRRVTVISSVPLLATYLDMNQGKNDPESDFWTMRRNGAFTYAAARKMLKELAKKAGIKKRIHPHLFRHSAATKLAKIFTESQMKTYLGWTGGSAMPAIYVHLSAKDTEDAVKKMNGIKTEAHDQVKSTIITCIRCKQRNSPGSKFCNKCGLVLDLQTAIKLEQKQKGANNLLETAIQEDPSLLQNPEMLSEFIQKEVKRQLAQRSAK